ncbi:hypothetical protein [Alkalihalobacterium chitinilyticum]|uniref:Uncharacterized protein n=1 Tax=Alkalihalobacterium chitinilyticum TaxID=2980103 RepID=A0ABT5VM55_9BACI|nr:hypothetical protein [Alkalihalobacterium chitinilyticum]MDE5416340.1 hypothetical protein [Alkalihalobacterium chitinilyticum]
MILKKTRLYWFILSITYIAVHPLKNSTITVGSFREDLYQTIDGGKSWIKIAEAGQPE